MRVSKVAKQLGVSADTVRYYTRIGILHPMRSENSYHFYSEKDLHRLRFVLMAKQLGFSLVDIKSIIDVSESGETPCHLVREIMVDNLERLEQSIEENHRLFRRMKTAVKAWDDMPNQVPTGNTICTLIEELMVIEEITL